MRDHRWFLVVAAVALFAGTPLAHAQGTTAPPSRKPATARGAAAKADAEERARKLAEGLAGTVKLLTDRDPQAGLRQLTQAATSSWTGPYLERMGACGPMWTDMLAAAQENRPADLATSALKGHLIVDGIYGELVAKTQEMFVQYMQLSQAGKDRSELDSMRREVEVGNKIRDYLASALDTFDHPMQIVLENAPSDVQMVAFEAIANDLPRAKPTRARLESLLQTGYERQRDPQARKAAAARMTALNVPLPAPSPAPPARKPKPATGN